MTHAEPQISKSAGHPADLSHEIAWAGVVCAVALGLWIWFRLYTGIQIEDSFITYRYAQNIAQENGFVYNPGERVLGTTSPLFTLILAGLGTVFGAGNIPIISVMLMLPAGIAAGWITFLALRKLGLPKWLPVFFLAAFFLNFNILWSMTGGLETPLVLLLMAASFYMLVTARWLWAAAFAALLVLTRIDGIVWAAGIFLVILLKSRTVFLKALLLGIAIVLPWTVFAFEYFGSPIPNTVIAKATIGQEDDHYVGLNIASYVGWWLLHIARISPFGRMIGFVLFGLGGWGIFRRYRSPALKLMFVFPFVFLIVYFVGRAPKFPWYLVPLIWTGIAVGSIGLWEAARLLRESLPESLSRPRAIRIGIVVFFVVYAVALFNRAYTTTQFHRLWQEEERMVRVPLARWLHDNSAPDATIAMEAVGYQGYYSQRRVVDLAGLISPRVVQWFRQTKSNAAVFDSVVTRVQPEFIVLRSYEVPNNRCFLGGPLFENDRQKADFDSSYMVGKVFPSHNPAFENWLFNLTVYRRKESS